jgi:sugar lactone lactonase YvrE
MTGTGNIMKRQFFILVAVLLLLSGCGSTPFDPPSDVVATAKASRIELSWKSVPSIIGYNVYRSTETGPVATKTRISSELSLTTYLDSSATAGITYYYQVTAYNSTGDSSPSPEISATIKAAPAGDILIGGAFQGVPLTMSYSVATMAGTAKTGATDGSGTSASFNSPIGITTDGKNLFVADTFNNSIRKIVVSTGEVTTVAGASASGMVNDVGSAARFYYPYSITTDGTALYVSDFGNHMIRRVDIASGVVTTLAGSSTSGSSNGVGAAAGFKNPRGITTDGMNVYVADSGNRTIRKIVIATGAVTTLAGSAVSGAVDGIGNAASFNNPEELTTDGTALYLTDSLNNNIRRIEISTGAVTTIAGSTVPGSTDGTGTAASFNSPAGITTDGTNLYVADSKNNTIRMIVIASGVVTKVAGSGSAGRTDGDGTGATFSQPMGITTDGANLFVSDFAYSLIREIL